MVLIESIEFLGFKTESRTAFVNFNSSAVCVIFGDNGCGKTSFLRLIHAVLSKDEQTLIQNAVREVILKLVCEGNRYVVKITKKKEVAGYNWDTFDSSVLFESTSLLLGVERGIADGYRLVDSRVLREFFRHPRRRKFLSAKVDEDDFCDELARYIRASEADQFSAYSVLNIRPVNNFSPKSIKMADVERMIMHRGQLARAVASKKIQEALFDTISSAIEMGPNISVVDFPEAYAEKLKMRVDLIREMLNDDYVSEFKSKVIRVLNDFERDGDASRIGSNAILSRFFLNIIDNIESEFSLIGSVKVLFDTFNDYLSHNKKLVIDGGRLSITVGNESHDLEQLSSGERHMLTFLTFIMFEGQKRQFLIIDEPEISLNVRWQRDLLQVFRGLVPNAQIIVASHSPAIVSPSVLLCPLEVKEG